MEPIDVTSAAWLAAGPALLALLWGARRRRASAAAPAAPAPEASMHRLELRMEALEGLQAALAAQVGERGAEEASERLQAMAGQILGLLRDKNASLDTALAGLDQLRARMRVLEQIGDPAEARALLERLGARLDAAQGSEAAARGALEARLAAVEGAAPPFAEVADRLAGLAAQKDAALETVLARLAPLEARLAGLEGARGPEALERLAERLEALRADQAAAEARLGAQVAGLQAPAESPLAEVAERLAGLHAQKDAALEGAFARLAPLEARLGELEGALAARDPQAALERLGERLESWGAGWTGWRRRPPPWPRSRTGSPGFAPEGTWWPRRSSPGSRP
jgi:DNA repair exonuclease SbcCD ATPase subunit